MTIYDKMRDYRNKTERIQKELTVEKEDIIRRLMKFYEFDPKTDSPRFDESWTALGKLHFDSPKQEISLARIDITDQDKFLVFDHLFYNFFKLDPYFARSQFTYPVIYCETLEEFYSFYYNTVKLSDQQKRSFIADQVKKEKTKGVSVLGFARSGVACYINGYVFGKKYNMLPKDVLRDQIGYRDVAETVIHEKLGHGFISVASLLGQTIEALGLINVLEASTLRTDTYSDPSENLRLSQYNILLGSSIIQQEGWSTWVESFIANHHFKLDKHPSLEHNKVWDEIDRRKPSNKEEYEALRLCRMYFLALFDDETHTAEEMLACTAFIKSYEGLLMVLFPRAFSRSARYGIGQLLFNKIEANAGVQCVPHAAIISGNIKVNPNEYGLNDLDELVSNNPRLNADARLAMISKLKLNKKNDINEFVYRIENELSIPVPEIYKKKS